MIGRSVSHYRVLGKLGQGGMGVVYQALDTRLRRRVALKFLPAELSSDQTARKRFEREARAVSALDHQNICTVYEVDDTDDGQTFIAMPCYDGRSLKARIEEGPLEVDEIIDIGTQIADGLVQAHRNGVVHRDLKPANVLVTDEGVVKIVDFGLARLLGESRLTSTNYLTGTPAYMAPEQVRGEEVDERADLWALGAVLYEMITGRPAFGGDYPEAVMYAVLNVEFGSLSGVPPDLAAIIEGCLQKDPEDRYGSAAEVRSALSAVQAGNPHAPPRVYRSVVPRSVRKQKRLIGGASAVVALALAATFLLSNPDRILTGLLSGAAASSELHLAVLPLRPISPGTQTEAYARGLTEVIASQLTQLDAHSETPFSVVPTSEVLGSGISSAEEVWRTFRANYVIEGGVQIEAHNVRLTLAVVDTRSLRQLETWSGDFAGQSAATIQDEAALQVARMLRMQLDPSAEQALGSAGTAVLDANDYYLQGRGYLQRYDDASNIDAAITLFHRAASKDPDFLLADAGLAEAHWRMYETTKDVAFADSALVYGRRVEAHRPLSAQVYVALGIVYAGTGRSELALETFNAALHSDPENAEALRGRADMLYALDRPNEAEAEYLKAIELQPQYWGAHNELGVFYFFEGRYEEALQQFKLASELTPDNPRPLRNLGAVFFHLERWEEARGWFERSLEIEPTYQAYSNLGTLHYYARRDSAAIEAFEKALDLQDNDPSIWSFLGTTYHFAGRREDARQAFRTALRKEKEREHIDVPNSQLAQASILAILGETATSLELLRGYQEDVHHPGAEESVEIAQIYEINGDRNEALKWVRTALERGYSEPDLRRRRWLDQLREDPGYEEILQSISPTTA